MPMKKRNSLKASCSILQKFALSISKKKLYQHLKKKKKEEKVIAKNF